MGVEILPEMGDIGCPGQILTLQNGVVLGSGWNREGFARAETMGDSKTAAFCGGRMGCDSFVGHVCKHL